jgi:hypothetical protein
VVFTNTPLVEYPAPSAEAVRGGNTFLEKLASINAKTAQTEQLNIARHTKAADEMATFKADVETQLTQLGDALSKLGDGFSNLSSDIDSRLAASTSAINDLKNMMTQFMAASSTAQQPQSQWQDNSQWQSHWYQNGHGWSRESRDQDHSNHEARSEDEFGGALDPTSAPGSGETTADFQYGVDIITSDHRGTPYGR